VNGLIALAAILSLLLVAGTSLGLMRRADFSFRWLLAAAALVAVNDALLTSGYGVLPNLIPSAEWNWQGKLAALALTLIVAALPAFGWRRVGLTFAQREGSLRLCVSVALAYCLFFAAIALAFPHEPASGETIAFQLSMPGLEEEPFYRGVLLFALDRAFAGRMRWLGVEWGWGAVLSCALFGLAHAFGYAHGHFSFHPLTMALTALPSFLAVWLRLRTGSLLLPVLLHNFGNSILLVL
jgi:uncharacterized protein